MPNHISHDQTLRAISYLNKILLCNAFRCVQFRHMICDWFDVCSEMFQQLHWIGSVSVHFPHLKAGAVLYEAAKTSPQDLRYTWLKPIVPLPSLPSLLMFCLSRWAWNATARRDMISWLIWIWRWWQNWRSGEQWSGTISSVRPRFRVFPLLRGGPRNTVFL